jgi:hypothetical protein
MQLRLSLTCRPCDHLHPKKTQRLDSRTIEYSILNFRQCGLHQDTKSLVGVSDLQRFGNGQASWPSPGREQKIPVIPDRSEKMTVSLKIP